MNLTNKEPSKVVGSLEANAVYNVMFDVTQNASRFTDVCFDILSARSGKVLETKCHPYSYAAGEYKDTILSKQNGLLRVRVTLKREQSNETEVLIENIKVQKA